jgi:hypothetical protein
MFCIDSVLQQRELSRYERHGMHARRNLPLLHDRQLNSAMSAERSRDRFARVVTQVTTRYIE